VVIDGGKAGILIELDAQTGRLLWKRLSACTTAMTRTGCSPSTPRHASRLALPGQVDVEPGAFGGIESQLASNGSATLAAVSNLPVVFRSESGPHFPSLAALGTALVKATGEMVAVNRTPARSNGIPRSRPRRTAPRP